MRSSRLHPAGPEAGTPTPRVPLGWYNSGHKRKPYLRWHVMREGPDGVARQGLATSEWDRAKQYADSHTRGAFIEDQWGKPTPEIAYLTSPALRALQTETAAELEGLLSEPPRRR